MNNKETVGEQVRRIADQLKQETDLQIKVTSRILGAAAQIAENQDRLIHEVVEMVEEDLEKQASPESAIPYTIESLKLQFKTLNEAKCHFGVKASSWATLANKLNGSSARESIQNAQSETLILKRLDTIEASIRDLHHDLNQVLALLQKLNLDQH
jgi:hypothetical protein